MPSKPPPPREWVELPELWDRIADLAAEVSRDCDTVIAAINRASEEKDPVLIFRRMAEARRLEADSLDRQAELAELQRRAERMQDPTKN